MSRPSTYALEKDLAEAQREIPIYVYIYIYVTGDVCDVINYL